MRDLVPGIRNPWRGFQNPTVSNFVMHGEHNMTEWLRKKTTLFTWAAFAGALESGKLADCCKVHSGYWSRTWTFSLNICANSLKLKAACWFPLDLARIEACFISFMSSWTRPTLHFAWKRDSVEIRMSAYGLSLSLCPWRRARPKVNANTVLPRYNEPLYNEAVGITNDFLCPSYCEQIL